MYLLQILATLQGIYRLICSLPSQDIASDTEKRLTEMLLVSKIRLVVFLFPFRERKNSTRFS